MTDYGPLWNELILLEAIIFFILIGYLIYLTIKTKLTHVEEFRRNFLTGVFIFLIIAAYFVVTQHFLTLEQGILNIMNIFGLIGLIISSALIIFGLFKLDEYIYSIIGVEKKTSKSKILLFSIPSPVIVYIINLIVMVDYSSVMVLHIMLVVYIIYYFIFIYTFFIHKEMKDIEINMMGYFGTGFLCQAINQVVGLFNEMLTDGPYYFLFQLFYVLLMVFLVAGYLNFKKRISKIKA